jgi:hypothetical protein
MPIKSRRYRKRNNKSRRTRKNKTTRRYKKQMKGGNGSIYNEEELKASYNDTSIKFWVVDDGVGDRRFIYKTNEEGKVMPYGKDDDNLSTQPPSFKGKINYYLKQVVNKVKDASIKGVK